MNTINCFHSPLILSPALYQDKILALIKVALKILHLVPAD